MVSALTVDPSRRGTARDYRSCMDAQLIDIYTPGGVMDWFYEKELIAWLEWLLFAGIIGLVTVVLRLSLNSFW